MAFNGKDSYNTFSKWLDDKGIDKSKLSDLEIAKLKSEYSQTKWWNHGPKKAQGNGGHAGPPGTPTNTNNFNPEIKPAGLFTEKDCKEIIAFDKEREALKGTQKKADPNKKIEYFQPNIPPKTPLNNNTTEQTAEESEEEKKKREEEQKFKDDWSWFDGATLIWGVEMMNLEIVPWLCERAGRQCPTPEQIVYKEKAKLLMKPGADMYAEKIKQLFKKPEYLAIGVWGAHLFMTVRNAPKIPVYNTFDPNNTEQPNNQNQ